MAGAHGSVFGRETTPPPGMTDVPNPNQGIAGKAKFSTDQTTETTQTVPDFEGTESGVVTDSEPVSTQETETETTETTETTQETETNDESGQTSESTEFDPLQLELKAAQLEAREAKVMAQEAQLSSRNNGAPPQEQQEEEEFKSMLDEIDPESLESEGERSLFKVAQALEEKLHTTEKQAQEASLESQRVRADANINRVLSEYDVSEAELEEKFAVTGVRDLDTLAKSILWDKAQTQTTKTQVKQGQQKRTTQVSKIAASGNSGASNNTTENNETGKRTNGNVNPFDGAQVSKFFQAFHP